MITHQMFLIYLNERLQAKGITIPELSKKLNYRTLIHVPHWFKGTGLPSASELGNLAELLEADPVVLSIGWLISQAPDLEEVMRREVLAGRAEKIPGND